MKDNVKNKKQYVFYYYPLTSSLVRAPPMTPTKQIPDQNFFDERYFDV